MKLTHFWLRSAAAYFFVASMSLSVSSPRAEAKTGGQDSAEPTQPIAIDVPVPQLAGGAKNWLNTGGKPLEIKKGHVYLIHFWTFGCINCKHNLPAYARWQKQFAKKDVTLIGIHTPETAEEKVTSNVTRRVKELGITYPILLDQQGKNWNRWQQQFWPTIYLIDKQGHVRYRWEGELEYEHAGGEAKMARLVDELLQEKQ